MSSGTEGTGRVDLTILCCTYNRCADLLELLASTRRQNVSGLSYEVVVVDNNSTDGTREAVTDLTRADPRFRYLFEPCQGKSHALNTGLREVRGEWHAVIDDDQILPPEYLATLARLITAHPDACCIGGKVLPIWEVPPPKWLTPAHWSPIAIADYGDAPLVITSERPICLLAGVFRTREALEAGGYDPALGLSKGSMGSIEDSDIQARMFARGGHGRYAPELRVLHKIPASRLTRSYQRRWHRGNGRHEALRRTQGTEVGAAWLLRVPGCEWRFAVRSGLRWISCLLRGWPDAAFGHELRLHFFAGYLMGRVTRRTRSSDGDEHPAERPPQEPTETVAPVAAQPAGRRRAIRDDRARAVQTGLPE